MPSNGISDSNAFKLSMYSRCETTVFLHLKPIFARFRMLDNGVRARQNMSDKKVSPWNIPVSMLTSSSLIVPLECGRWILVIHCSMEDFMRLAMVESILYKRGSYFQWGTCILCWLWEEWWIYTVWTDKWLGGSSWPDYHLPFYISMFFYLWSVRWRPMMGLWLFH